LVDLVIEATSAGRETATRKAMGLEPFSTGIGVSVATKLLHKKRPALLPILDAEAIFRSYLQDRDPDWRTCGPSVRRALERIQVDLRAKSNASGWSALEASWPWLTRIELFDIVWWEHDRPRRLVAQKRPAPPNCLMTRGQKCNGSCPPR
jgi:hypothetical protein